VRRDELVKALGTVRRPLAVHGDDDRALAGVEAHVVPLG